MSTPQMITNNPAGGPSMVMQTVISQFPPPTVTIQAVPPATLVGSGPSTYTTPPVTQGGNAPSTYTVPPVTHGAVALPLTLPLTSHLGALAHL